VTDFPRPGARRRRACLRAARRSPRGHLPRVDPVGSDQAGMARSD